MKEKHNCVVYKTENHVSYQGVHPGDAMKTGCHDCVYTKTYRNEVSQDFYFTTTVQ